MSLKEKDNYKNAAKDLESLANEFSDCDKLSDMLKKAAEKLSELKTSNLNKVEKLNLFEDGAYQKTAAGNAK